jgi:dTDP-4-dehydrorhamnose reductase
VFDGNSKTPYKEDAKTNPQGIYGKTKLMGELAIQAIGCKYMIIRTAWVFSEYGNNFLKTILRLAEERSELNIIGDQIGCPTYAQDIAKSIVIIMGMLKSKNNIQGIYNFVNDFGCSWADFADDILNEAIKQNIIENKPKINKIRTSDFPTLAKRPKQSQLDFSKFEKTFGINQSNYVDGISSALLAYKNLKFK